jgi:hypothetical protein
MLTPFFLIRNAKLPAGIAPKFAYIVVITMVLTG